MPYVKVEGSTEPKKHLTNDALHTMACDLFPIATEDGNLLVQLVCQAVIVYTSALWAKEARDNN